MSRVAPNVDRVYKLRWTVGLHGITGKLPSHRLPSCLLYLNVITHHPNSMPYLTGTRTHSLTWLEIILCFTSFLSRSNLLYCIKCGDPIPSASVCQTQTHPRITTPKLVGIRLRRVVRIARLRREEHSDLEYAITVDVLR